MTTNSVSRHYLGSKIAPLPHRELLQEGTILAKEDLLDTDRCGTSGEPGGSPHRRQAFLRGLVGVHEAADLGRPYWKAYAQLKLLKIVLEITVLSI